MLFQTQSQTKVQAQGASLAAWQSKRLSLPPLQLAALMSWQRVVGVSHTTLCRWLTDGLDLHALWHAKESSVRETLMLKEVSLGSWQSLRKVASPSQLYEDCLSQNVRVLSILDDHYPSCLRETYHPPALLYMRGNIEALSATGIGIVGTRLPSPNGISVTQQLVSALKGLPVSIISGLALGIDSQAHETAVQEDISTIAVFGCSVDHIYPRENRGLANRIIEQGGLLLSEYPLGTTPNRFRFPQRNRLLAGLSQALVVVEGPLNSGALITARYAVEENRTVYAVPGPIGLKQAAGPNQLLKDGAQIIVSAAGFRQDLCEDLNLIAKDSFAHNVEYEPEKHEPLAAHAMQSEAYHPASAVELPTLLQFIPTTPISIEALHQQTKLPLSTLLTQLSLLELEEHVSILPGTQIVRVFKT
ncbi:MAG: DNA-processing protein DprA [Candidatus Melainabacteria bacterium]|nr:DNA-processing protein DprA [Candidatus Melainabacteria bacterium]